MTRMLRFARTALFATLMAMVLAPGSTLAASAGPGELAPDFTVQTIAGTPYSLAEHRGRVVVLMFTAPGCGECIPELVSLSKIHAEYASRGVDILAVNVDPYMTTEDVAEFKDAIGDADYAWAQDEGGIVTRAYGVRALETTVIIDRSGRIAYRDERTTLADDYRALLAPLL